MKFIVAVLFVLLMASCKSLDQPKQPRTYSVWQMAGKMNFYNTHTSTLIRIDEANTVWLAKGSSYIINWSKDSASVIAMCLLGGKARFQGNKESFYLAPAIVYHYQQGAIAATNKNAFEYVEKNQPLYDSFDQLIKRVAVSQGLPVIYTDKIPHCIVSYNAIEYGSPDDLLQKLNSIDRYTRFKIKNNKLLVTNHH